MTHRRGSASLMERLALYPWWVSVAAGIGFYLAFSEFLPRLPLELGLYRPIVDVVFHFASWVSILFVIPAVMSVVHSWRGRRLLAKHQTIDAIRSLTWHDFENFIEAYYKEQGFRVSRSFQDGADGGVDVRIASSEGKVTLIQCKQWRTRSVGVRVVRELLGVVTAENVDRGIVITAGKFTREAEDFANGVNIDLVDGDRLIKMVSSSQRLSQRFLPTTGQ